MKQRGKKSSSALSVVAEIKDSRPSPPSHLSDAEGEVWKRIAATKPHDWFAPDSFDLLTGYCQNVVAAAEMDELIKSTPRIDLDEQWGLQRYEKLKKLKDMHTQRYISLATKMRLTQQSRYTPKASNTANKNTPKKKLWESE